MSHAPADLLERRHAAIRGVLPTQTLDALLVTSLPNVLYLTNFTGTAGVVLLTTDRLLFVTDSRYVTAVESMRGLPHECRGLELVLVDGSYDAVIARVLASLPAQRIGFEAAH